MSDPPPHSHTHKKINSFCKSYTLASNFSVMGANSLNNLNENCIELHPLQWLSTLKTRDDSYLY